MPLWLRSFIRLIDNAKGLAREIGGEHRARLFLAASGGGHDQLTTPASKILFACRPTFPIIPGAAELLDQIGGFIHGQFAKHRGRTPTRDGLHMIAIRQRD
jgi:hypothetical protein